MDRLNHADNILLNRKDLFDKLQDMIFGNIGNIFWGAYKYEQYKILCGRHQIGVMAENDLMVARGIGSIDVSPGIATNDETSFMVLGETQNISLSSQADGHVYVALRYAQKKSFTGKELPVAVKGRVNSATMYTLLEDSAIASIHGDAQADGVNLARVSVYSHGVPTDCVMATLSEDIYQNDVGTYIPSTAPYVISAWVKTLNYEGSYPYTIDILVGGDEYMQCEITEGGTVTAVISSRGGYGTLQRHHYAGESVVIPGIVDMRPLATLQLREDSGVQATLSKGMVNIGGVHRRLMTMVVNRMTVAPIISIGTSPIMWVNRSRSMGMVTDRVKNVYYGIQSSGTNISNYKAAISDIRYRMLGADDTERVALSAEMRRVQQDLISANVIQQEMLSALSDEEIAGYMKAIPNVFSLMVNINHESMVEEEVAQYEAEVTRSLISSLTDNYAASNPDRYLSGTRRPIGYGITGSPIYPPRAEFDITQMAIPINIGERVRVRVRAISHNGIAGEYSNYITYEFVSFNDNEYVSYQGIYNIIMPDIMKNVSTLNEYVNYIKDMWDQISSLPEIVGGYQGRLSAIEKDISDIKAIIDQVQPIIPAIPKLITQAIAYIPETQETIK